MPEVEDPANIERLSRNGVQLRTLRREVAMFNGLVAGSGSAVGRSAPPVDPEMLTRLHRRAEHEAGIELADPNLFYFVHSQRTDPDGATKLLRALRGLSIVEAAYFQPIPFDAVDIAPTTTIDVTHSKDISAEHPRESTSTLHGDSRGDAARASGSSTSRPDGTSTTRTYRRSTSASASTRGSSTGRTARRCSAKSPHKRTRTARPGSCLRARSAGRPSPAWTC